MTARCPRPYKSRPLVKRSSERRNRVEPLILVTNDDGVLSPGLVAAVEAVQELGEVLISAPRYQQTSMSRAFPIGDGLGRIEIIDLEVGPYSHRGFGVHGSPAQAVSHAILEIAGRTPNLCVSGINYGENLGMSVFHSGTIGAALEASTYGIPGLAVSLEAGVELHETEDYPPMDWQMAKRFTRLLAAQILKEGLSGDIALLNVNVPGGATPETEVRVTIQSRQDYLVLEKPDSRDFAAPLRLRTSVRIDESSLEADCDVRAFALDQVVSVTPLTWSLTAREHWMPRF
jgi:5'-nucleotidase